MILAVAVPAIVAVFGLLLWGFAKDAKLQTIGQWMFIIGLFWVVGVLANKTIKL